MYQITQATSIDKIIIKPKKNTMRTSKKTKCEVQGGSDKLMPHEQYKKNVVH